MKLNLQSFMEKAGSLLILLILIICMGLVSPKFFALDNLKNIGIQASVNVVLSIGMLMVIIIGGIDLSIGAVLALAGIVSAYLMKAGCPIFWAMLISCFAGAALGAVNGFIVTYMKLPPFVATLGTTGIFRGTALLITNGLPVSQLPEAVRVIGQGTFIGIPNPIVIMIFTAVVIHILLVYTSYGRSLYAIGSNYEAARLSGIAIKRNTMLTYTIEGFLAAAAGVILLGRLAVAQPNAAAGYESNAIAAAVIGGASFSGGRGSVKGSLIGALIISVLNNGFTLLGLNSFVQQIAIGVVVVLAVFADILQREKVS